jgi:hypothetical protein
VNRFRSDPAVLEDLVTTVTSSFAGSSVSGYVRGTEISIVLDATHRAQLHKSPDGRLFPLIERLAVNEVLRPTARIHEIGQCLHETDAAAVTL